MVPLGLKIHKGRDSERREMAHCPDSCWAEPVRETEPSSSPAWFCPVLSCFSGNSLGTGAGRDASAGGGDRTAEATDLSPVEEESSLSQDLTAGWNITRTFGLFLFFYSFSLAPHFLCFGRVGVSLGGRKLPSLSQVCKPALWVGSNWTLQPGLLSFCLSWHKLLPWHKQIPIRIPPVWTFLCLSTYRLYDSYLSQTRSLFWFQRCVTNYRHSGCKAASVIEAPLQIY